jgi:hypothetical protein
VQRAGLSEITPIRKHRGGPYQWLVDVSPANPQVRLLDMISDLRTGAKEIGVTSDRSTPGFELRLRIRQANENTSTNRLDLTGCSRNT